MGGNRHINSTSLFCFHLENVKNRMSGCKCKRSIAHGHPLLTLQLHTELITYFQPHRCDRVSQALTQPSSYLYFTLFLAQCNPGVKYQDPSPAFSWSSLLPLVFLSSFSFPSKCSFQQERLLGKQINCSTFLYIRILPSHDGNNSQNPSKVPGQTQKDMALLGFEVF